MTQWSRMNLRKLPPFASQASVFLPFALEIGAGIRSENFKGLPERN